MTNGIIFGMAKAIVFCLAVLQSFATWGLALSVDTCIPSMAEVHESTSRQHQVSGWGSSVCSGLPQCSFASGYRAAAYLLYMDPAQANFSCIAEANSCNSIACYSNADGTDSTGVELCNNSNEKITINCNELGEPVLQILYDCSSGPFAADSQISGQASTSPNPSATVRYYTGPCPTPTPTFGDGTSLGSAKV